MNTSISNSRTQVSFVSRTNWGNYFVSLPHSPVRVLTLHWNWNFWLWKWSSGASCALNLNAMVMLHRGSDRKRSPPDTGVQVHVLFLERKDKTLPNRKSRESSSSVYFKSVNGNAFNVWHQLIISGLFFTVLMCLLCTSTNDVNVAHPSCLLGYKYAPLHSSVKASRENLYFKFATESR